MSSDTATLPAKSAHRFTTAAPLILVAEDDRDSREALAAFLQSLGYRVVQATGGDEAMRLIDSRDDLAMVLTDVKMPGMSGIELMQAMRARRSSPKVVLVTGDPKSIDDAISSHAIAVLKPYDFGILERVVSDALNTHET